jgi:DNA-directed RNA polymerase alpha subunit
MAQLTNDQIGKAIRDAVASVTLNGDIEVVNKVTIIINVEAKHKFNNAIYVKGGKGLNIENPNQDTEDIKNAW